MNRKLFSLEDDATGDTELLAPESQVSEAEEVAEVESQASEIEESTATLETGAEAAEELEEVQDLVEGAVESGEGLDPVAAEAVGLALKVIYSKLGLDSHSLKSTYSSESYNAPSSRLANTKLALEGIIDKAKEVWDKVWKFLVSLYDKVMDFIKDYIPGIQNARRRLEAIKGKLNAATAKTTGKISLTSSFVKELKLTNGSEPGANLSNVPRALDEILASIAGATAVVNTAVDASKSSVAAMKTVVEKKEAAPEGEAASSDSAPESAETQKAEAAIEKAKEVIVLWGRVPLEVTDMEVKDGTASSSEKTVAIDFNMGTPLLGNVRSCVDKAIEITKKAQEFSANSSKVIAELKKQGSEMTSHISRWEKTKQTFSKDSEYRKIIGFFKKSSVAVNRITSATTTSARKCAYGVAAFSVQYVK